MKIIFIFFILLTSVLAINSCCEDTENNEINGVCGTTNCDSWVIIDDSLFQNAPNDHVDILDMSIEGDCLKVKFASSGCSGDTWEVLLIGKKEWLYSNPPSKELRLSLKNSELCEAYITKEISFDIRELHQTDSVKLILSNYDEWILYK